MNCSSVPGSGCKTNCIDDIFRCKDMLFIIRQVKRILSIYIPLLIPNFHKGKVENSSEYNTRKCMKKTREIRSRYSALCSQLQNKLLLMNNLDLRQKI